MKDEIEKFINEYLHDDIQYGRKSTGQYNRKFDYKKAIRQLHQLIKSQRKPLEIKIKKLEFMIENGLDWKDMQNDIQLPHEL